MTVPYTFTAGSSHVAFGSRTFTTVGSSSWAVPVGVTAISILCVGGGGGGSSNAGAGGGGALAYANDVAVTPGSTLTVIVGDRGLIDSNGSASTVQTSTPTVLCSANGGSRGVSAGTGGAGGTVATGTGFAGGKGGDSGAGSRGGGGGGAGGYTAVGGAGGNGNASGTSSTGGGGGGGGGSSTSNSNGAAGGGVGVSIGLGVSGAGGGTNTVGGSGSIPIGGTAYGAGGASGGLGVQGVVKIVWRDPNVGSTRTFPSTRIVDDTDFQIYVVSQTSSTASTIAVPSGAQAGDVAVLFDYGTNASTTIPTSVTPTGFTLISDASISSTSSGRSVISYKVLVSGDLGGTITGINATTNEKILFIFRPNQPVITSNSLSITLSTPGSQAVSSGNPSNQTISMSSLNSRKSDCLLYFSSYRFGFGATAATRGATGPSFTEVGTYIKYGEFIASETTSDATISMSATGTPAFQILQSFYMLLQIV